LTCVLPKEDILHRGRGINSERGRSKMIDVVSQARASTAEAIPMRNLFNPFLDTSG